MEEFADFAADPAQGCSGPSAVVPARAQTGHTPPAGCDEQGPEASIPSLAWCGDAPGGAATRPTHPTEERLARLAAAVGPLRRVVAALAERLIATQAYERLCYARLSDYARERLGRSARQIHDLAHVHRALAGLPALERALLANELPWSKVRLLARVASAEDEAAWIARARAVSTHRLEPMVRSEQEQRKGTRAGALDAEAFDDALPQRCVKVRCTPAVREKWGVAREMAERMAGQRLSAGEALEWVVAEVFSGISVHPAFADLTEAPPARGGAGDEDRTADAAAAAGREPAESARAPARELPGEVTALAAGLEEADAFELDRRLRLALRLEQSLDAALAPLLRRVTCSEYEWRGEYQSLARYAADGLGMSPRKARALLRLERAGDVCPELRAAYRSGRLSWVKAQCLVPLFLLDLPDEWRPVRQGGRLEESADAQRAAGEWRVAWLAWAEKVTVRRLEQDVERALLLRAGHHLAWQRCKHHPERAQDPIPAGERQLCAHDVDVEATEEIAFRVPHEVAGLYAAVRETLRRCLQIECGRPAFDSEVFDAMLDSALLTWTLRDPSRRRPDPVIERDGWRCAVPGCTSRRSLHDHHVVHRSQGGGDAATNRVTLCAFHHERCVHGGRMRVRGCAPEGLGFELGVRAGGSPLVRYRHGDVEAREDELGPPVELRSVA